MSEEQEGLPFVNDFADSDRREAYDRIYPEPDGFQPERFDPELARMARDAALDQVEANSNVEWSDLFYSTIEAVATEMEEFTADEIWERLSRMPNVPRQHQPRAAGPVVVRALKAGVIRKADKLPRKSNRASCHHRPIAVYESLIFREAA